MGIQRYQDEGYDYSFYKDENGEWIKFDDYQLEVLCLEEKIQELELKLSVFESIHNL